MIAASAATLCPRVFADQYSTLQSEIDKITPKVWAKYRATGDIQGFAALKRLDEAFTEIVQAINATTVTNRPAVWYLYNMGFIVKTREALFSIDLNHPRALELVPKLDFALITHNHGDHYTESFLNAMDQSGKVVIQNFHSNYGAGSKKGGYTRAKKTFELKDVKISTALTDHNDYLIDFTTMFEIAIGDYTIYHTGDCATEKKFKLNRKNPDLWIVHPRCGLMPVAGAEVIRPKKTLIVHLNEMGHARDRWRWTWADGLAEKAKLEAAGYTAEVPIWGEKVV